MECNYHVGLGWPLTIAYGFGFSRDSMHTSEIITQPPQRRYLSIGLTTADLEPELILMRVWKLYSLSDLFANSGLT